MRRNLAALILGLAVAGCAALPPAARLQPGDLPQLAGSWAWTERIGTPAPLGGGPLKVRVEDGLLHFRSGAAEGALTLYEDASRRVLKGEGRSEGGRSFPVELTQLRGGAPGPSGSAALTLLVDEERTP